MARRFRRAAKVLLVDPSGRVLLFRGIDRTRPMLRLGGLWWVGGWGTRIRRGTFGRCGEGVFEETGLRITDPGPVVATVRFDWDFEGFAYDQEETYVGVRVRRAGRTPSMPRCGATNGGLSTSSE